MGHHYGLICSLWWYSFRVSALFNPFIFATLISVNSYDTGTIGGIIAMDDWLKNFGTFDSTGTLGLQTNGYYLPANDKSLVVRIPHLLLSIFPT